jgi:AraC family transcriptional regulator, transcriptional activator of pobA
MDNQQSSHISDFNSELKLKGFKVYEIDSTDSVVRVYNRKDFYKICLNNGRNIIHYADRSFETDGSVLFFGNPHIPYSWKIVSTTYTGYACLFTEDFLKTSDRSESLQQSPLFKIEGTPIFNLNNEQKEFISTLFQKMIAEQSTDYSFKDDLIRNYINLIIHEALKMQPSENYSNHKNASSRIASVFLELLERQFPIESTEHPLQLKSAQDFAKRLSVHVNHLNRSVKEVTGKPTTTHIAERIITEAKALLQHTDWNIADIAYALGFDYPTYFNNYFKRMTGTAPSSLREQIV